MMSGTQGICEKLKNIAMKDKKKNLEAENRNRNKNNGDWRSRDRKSREILPPCTACMGAILTRVNRYI